MLYSRAYVHDVLRSNKIIMKFLMNNSCVTDKIKQYNSFSLRTFQYTTVLVLLLIIQHAAQFIHCICLLANQQWQKYDKTADLQGGIDFFCHCCFAH